MGIFDRRRDYDDRPIDTQHDGQVVVNRVEERPQRRSRISWLPLLIIPLLFLLGLSAIPTIGRMLSDQENRQAVTREQAARDTNNDGLSTSSPADENRAAQGIGGSGDTEDSGAEQGIGASGPTPTRAPTSTMPESAPRTGRGE